MTSHSHCSLKRFFLTVGLSSALVFVGSCNSSDSIGARGAGGSGGSSTSTAATSGGAQGNGGAVGTGGQAGPDAAPPKADAPLSADGQSSADLCLSTGGKLSSAMCCLANGDFPNTCLVGACSCSATSSHQVATCDCPTGSCFSPTTGCGPLVIGGTGGRIGSGGAAGSGGAGGGAGGSTGAKLDAPVSTDATALADLCLSTGGQLANQQACLSVSEFPNTCIEAACSPENSHTVTGCACATGFCFSPTTGCGPLGGTGGSRGSGGALGNGGAGGGAGGNTGTKLDAPVSTDANSLAALCTSTGGQIKSGLCCASASDFPDSCLTGACGCAPENSHTVQVCQCPTGLCFYPALGGCVRGIPGSGLDAGTASDAGRCTAQPGLDTSCGGTYPPHYYACVGNPPSASCVVVTIGDMTDGYCCP